MNLCRDCKHVRVNWFLRIFSSHEFSMCAKTINPGTGRPEGFCSVMRCSRFPQMTDACGFDGAWFEPKKRKAITTEDA